MAQNRVSAAFLHIIATSRLLRVLGNDTRAIVTAASRAQAAADYLIARAETAHPPSASPALVSMPLVQEASA